MKNKVCSQCLEPVIKFKYYGKDHLPVCLECQTYLQNEFAQKQEAIRHARDQKDAQLLEEFRKNKRA